MECLCNQEIFSFNHKDISGKKPNTRHNINNIWPRKFVAAEFSIVLINFRIKAKPDGFFSINFRLPSIYLVKDVQLISMPTNCKWGLDEITISPPSIRKIDDQVNLLCFSIRNTSKRERIL